MKRVAAAVGEGSGAIRSVHQHLAPSGDPEPTVASLSSSSSS
jgi:hypothetical protein